MPPIKLGGCLSILVLLTACTTDSRVASKKYVANGNKYFQRGKYKEASLLYRRALNKDGKSAEAWYRLGLTNTKLSAFAEARRDFARSMELDPADTSAIVKLADLDLLFYAMDPRGNKVLLADLKDLAQRLLKRDKRSFDGLRFSGEIALIEKDVKTAIQRFQEANQAKPDQPELVLALVQTLFADHQSEQAEKVANDLIGKQKSYGPIYDVLYVYYLRTRRPELAEELLQKKIASNPSEGAYLMQLAFHYYMSDRKAGMKAAIERLTSNPKAFPEARLQVGDFYARIHELDQALEQYGQGAKENPKDKRIYDKKLVEVLASEGKSEPASALLTKLLKEDPKDPEAIALHATLLLAKGDKRDIKNVISELAPLVTKLPGNAVLHYNLGRAYLASGDQRELGQARIQFEQALKIDSRYVPAGLGLAELELLEGQSAGAVQHAEAVLKIEPANVRARLVRARGLMNMAENDKARDELTTVIAMDPKSNDARFEFGQLDLKERRYRDAEADFQTLTEANDPRGVAGAIECRVQQGHLDQALRMVQGLLKQAPDRMDYRRVQADLLFRAAKCAEAATQFQSLIDHGPRSAELYRRLGKSKARLNDVAGAIKAFQDARALAPNDAAPDLDLAILYDHTSSYAAARKAYEDAIRKQPDNPTALNNLAYLEADQGVDLDQALAYAQQARAKLPGDVNVIDTLGLIYIKKNLNDDGLRLLRDASSRKADSATFHLHLALALYQKGDRPAARKELDAARRNKPTEREHGKIQELLAKVG